MRALITGGFGFIGSHLTRHLLDKGWGVTVVDLEGAAPCVALPMEKLTVINGPYYAPEVIAQCSGEIDVCFHLASSVGPALSNEKIVFDIETNLIGTVSLLDALSPKQIRRFVYISSGGTVYGTVPSVPISEDQHGFPTCSYGIVKKAVEYYLHLYSKIYGMRYNVIRLANPYGVGQRLNYNQGAIANFIGKIINNVPLEIWGDGSVIRDYIYIDDVVRAIVAAAESDAENEIFNIGSGVGLSLNQIVKILRDDFQLPFEVKYQASRNVDVPVNILDITKALAKLNWRPEVDVKSGIEATLTWARGQ
ncbi:MULTISPECIES: NAD-dependent epimerase/dehydratase family protein [Burkholderia]|uniref:NAD-dependent epimerase/dehydratase family protein n=1 Tax=Burkholderia TaxID=32008 RepID=UPI000550C065|nr:MULTISPECIES: NAD-dependent epimerase/dehydratase family protein [Burkholderia]TCT32366.1 UDP-glucose 4-epimerase [Burkholderia vietnamiensis]SCZ44442.1 UDP-glucose 4-epimerase [Burkholderia vietnamiensis]SFY35338.1 UDP-glucose 4-epimerase [Burkholderia vietnamiensis]